MTSVASSGQQAVPGSVLLVIHDFVARSPDELSLTKGDRIELIERDDDFGDGWFLGKHLSNGNTGLFPEVYTRPAPKATNPPPPPVSAGPSVEKRAISEDYSVKPSSLDGANSHHRISAPDASSSASAVTSHNPVMTETLDVIKEHINDMNTPRGSYKSTPVNDPMGIYAPPPDIRASYIRGQETDEEESHQHSETEVLAWSPVRVAEYLEDQGVEKQHCDVFQEQEISGEVLLNMEQSSIFIKEFDLGSVGRRLKTWQKVKALQDEVRVAPGTHHPRSVSNYSIGDETVNTNTDDSEGTRQRSSTLGGSSPSLLNSMQKQRLGPDARSNTAPYQAQHSPQPSFASLARQDTLNRPSAHTVRSMQHTRRHSSLGSDISMQRAIMPSGPASADPTKISHERTRSSTGFDMSAKRTSRFGHKHNLSSGSHASQAPQDWGLGPMGSPNDVDRGYFSGNEVDKRNRRSVLQKKSVSAAHSRNPSESTVDGRASYQSKVDSPVGPMTGGGGGMFGRVKGMRAASSPKTLGKTFANDNAASPVVTKLDYNPKSPALPNGEATSTGNSPSTGTFSFFSKPKATGLRVASEPAAQAEKSVSTSKPSPLNSPTRTGSTTPSTESHSMDQQKSEKSRLSTGSSQGLAQTTPVQPAPRSRPRARSKKLTSAYTRGLEKKTPLEQIEGSDYSGWMKKKSASIVGTWKPRLFVLRGRRLSYYYTENDVEEKGLIDISGHRVLPAENDRMTGLHATLTGAKSPQSPENLSFATGASSDMAALPEQKGDEGLFIFKLVPPRQGMSKAVNFTKPTIHYFAVNSRREGRLWMAALMKATIDYDSSGKVTTSYNQPTISLAKAKARKERPPALREAGAKKVEREEESAARSDSGQGLGIGGLEGGSQADAGAEQSGASVTGEDTGLDSLAGSLKKKEAAALIS